MRSSVRQVVCSERVGVVQGAAFGLGGIHVVRTESDGAKLRHDASVHLDVTSHQGGRTIEPHSLAFAVSAIGSPRAVVQLCRSNRDRCQVRTERTSVDSPPADLPVADPQPDPDPSPAM